jgi:SAM-dependent methyltransferase
MDINKDAYGQQLLAQFNSQIPTEELIERDDNYIDTGSEPGFYFLEYKQWSPLEKQLIQQVKGKVLDIGCGAGRHSLYLQQKGFDVTAIDNSPGAIEVCKLRGLNNVFVRSIVEVDKFPPNSFDTILMLGNNFGLFSDAENAKRILRQLHHITTSDAKIMAGTRNPYQTDDPNHLEYHEFNRRRNRMPGQIRMRVRYKKTVGEWFDYLFVSPEEMKEIVSDTGWKIEEFIESGDPDYLVVISKIF